MNLFEGIDFTSLDAITKFIKRLTDFAIDLIGIVCIIFIIISGIQYIASSGNQEQSTKAKASLTWAIVGLIIVVTAKIIVPFFASLIQK